MFKLTIEDDEGKTTVIPLVRDEMTIGRQDGNTIRLTERNISRKHARLLRQNGTMYVEDLASYTGVRVNGARIVAVTPVAEGDEVEIGDYKLMVRIDRPPVNVTSDRATMPAMPAVLGPMNSVGGSVAIPTRGTPAMAGAGAARPSPPHGPAVPPGVPALASPSAPAPVVRVSAPVPHAVSAVPDPLEAQPTIPVRTLSEAKSPSGQIAAETSARVVVLTSELAGQEFSLARASVVIGRTDENDVVIHHRSISRHHAKIVREGDLYTIVDLQSANGVRVNNEDYERIELHAGDVVELGHVKLRFGGPFEHYVFDPNVRHDKRPFPVKIAAGVGAVVVVGVVVFALRPSHAPVAPAPVVAAAAPMAAPGVTPQTIFADATRAASAEDWADARAALDKLGAATGDAALDKQAADLGRRVDLERQTAPIYAQLGEAAATKKYAEALDRYAEIPDASLYKAKGRARADEARALLVAERLADAEKARAAGRCADVRAAADDVTKLDPKNQLPQELVRLCRNKPEPVAARPARARAVAVVPAARERATERQPERQVEKPVEAAAEPEVDADFLMKQARDAWLRQQCGSAIELSRKALKAKPGETDAYQIIAACSCSLKDVEGATRAYAKLDERNRNLVHSLCAKNGVIVGGEAQ
ncbi:MAG TPA: FHA domain-containing protein [Polyangia bacterium]|nr:FHA domain-containing protein [Polyangia bacterium]